MVMKTCLDCGRLIPATDRRCSEHARLGNRRGATTAERGYGTSGARCSLALRIHGAPCVGRWMI
jgi:hypothetical protein